MGTITPFPAKYLESVPSVQFDCHATLIPENSSIDADAVIESCRYNDSVREGLEGIPGLEYFCVQFEGRPIEVYTEQALRASL